MNYWEECVSEALDEALLVATEGQIAIIASIVEGSHENYGMAFGHDCIPNPLCTEIDKLKKELKREQTKEICETCNGKGRLVSYGGTFQSTSDCHKCNGEGFIYRE